MSRSSLRLSRDSSFAVRRSSPDVAGRCSRSRRVARSLMTRIEQRGSGGNGSPDLTQEGDQQSKLRSHCHHPLGLSSHFISLHLMGGSECDARIILHSGGAAKLLCRTVGPDEGRTPHRCGDNNGTLFSTRVFRSVCGWRATRRHGTARPDHIRVASTARGYYLTHDSHLENWEHDAGDSLLGKRHGGGSAADGPRRIRHARRSPTAAPDVPGPRRPAARPPD